MGAAGLCSEERRPLWWVEGACVLVLPLLFVLCSIYVRPWLVGAREVTLHCVVWRPGNEPTLIEDKFGILTEEETRRLRALRLGGTLFVTASTTSGKVGSPPSANILIIQRQVTQETVLPVAWSAKTLILIQRPDGWERDPAQGRTLQNAAFVVRAEDHHTIVRVEMRIGSTQMCGFTWTR